MQKKKNAELNLNATPNSAPEFHVEQELWLLDGSALFVWKWYDTFYILLQTSKGKKRTVKYFHSWEQPALYLFLGILQSISCIKVIRVYRFLK